jgi:triacylglycerol lipase
MNIFLLTFMIILSLFGILSLIVFLFLFFKWLKYKKALEIPIYNKLQCGEIYCLASIVDLDIPHQKGQEFNFKVARFLADLCVRISSAVNKPFIQPKILKNELLMYDSNKNPIFGVLWSHNRIAYIAFRGTMEAQEWIQNFTYQQKSFLMGNKMNQKHALFLNNSKNSPNIHSGFLNVYNNFRNNLVEKIKEINPTQVIIGGHSLGGAIATICGLDLKILGYNTIVYNFASPRVGDDGFCDLVNKSNLPLYRIVNTCDIAPAFPMSVSPNFDNPENPFIYTHCGNGVYFTENWKSLVNNHIMGVYVNWLDKHQ